LFFFFSFVVVAFLVLIVIIVLIIVIVVAVCADLTPAMSLGPGLSGLSAFTVPGSKELRAKGNFESEISNEANKELSGPGPVSCVPRMLCIFQ
jgi:hypothetical protein